MSPSRLNGWVLGLLWAPFSALSMPATPVQPGPTAQGVSQVLLTGFQHSGRWAASQGSLTREALSCIEAVTAERFALIVQSRLDTTLPRFEREQLDQWFGQPGRAQLLPALMTRALNPNGSMGLSPNDLSPQDQQDLTLLKNQGTLDKMLRALMNDPTGQEALRTEAQLQIQRCKQP